jgi:hypothetical protein
MAVTYSWRLKTLRKADREISYSGSLETVNNYVYQTYWEKVGTDSDFLDEDGNPIQAIFEGATPFEVSQTYNPDVYTDYNNLSQSQILDWVFAEISGSDGYAEHIDYRINTRLDELRTWNDERIESGSFPWDE